MNGSNSAASGHSSGFVAHHLVAQADRFVPDFQDRRTNRDDVTRVEFPFVLDLLFNRCRACPLFLKRYFVRPKATSHSCVPCDRIARDIRFPYR
jgi:hypothetical protein